MSLLIIHANNLDFFQLNVFVAVALVKRRPVASRAKVSTQANVSYQLTAHSATL